MNEIMQRLRAYVPSKVLSYPKPIGTLSYSCPPEVDLTELTHCTEYLVGPHKITFYYTTEHTDDLFGFVDRLLWVLEPKPIVADILLTSSKKFYPKGKVFGPSNVNTGYSSDKVVVYRKEEWFKVLIHEFFHYLHHERVLFEASLQKRILKIFKVDSEVNLYESYCEVWARTLNCCILSSCNHVPVKTLLYHEKKYSLRHMVNVLHHMGLTYPQLFEPSDYREETNVLAYVVLTAILMHHDFLAHMPGFTLTDAEPYVAFLEKHCRDKHFLYAVKRIKPRVTTTMSYYDVTKCTGKV
jgi:hypothetical protein